MRVDAFDFTLPSDRIALEPVYPREQAKLLCVEPDGLYDRTIENLPNCLQPGDLLIFNNTKVIPARLMGWRDDVQIDVTLHRPLAAGQWLAFARPGKRLSPGQRVAFAEDFSANVLEKRAGGEILLQFSDMGTVLFDKIDQYGLMPLPPYIAAKRAPRAQDRQDYQTIFASRDGAVAAPTAALHFTPSLMEKIARRGIEHRFVTLHVGAGTFLPVKTEDTKDHVMHAEWGEISTAVVASVEEVRRKGGRIIAVGTTVLRLLEAACQGTGRLAPFLGDTDIFITPGHRFRVADLLLTNFHLPRSTLFMLVSAFAGLQRMQAAYAHAIERHYRFYSYGDACLLYLNPESRHD